MLTKTIIPSAQTKAGIGKPGLLDRLARNIVIAGLQRIAVGRLILTDGVSMADFGEHHCSGDLTAQIQVLDPRFYRAIAWGGTLGAGNAYINGWWACDDLTRLIRVILQNDESFAQLNGGRTSISAMALRGWNMLRRNTLKGSRHNIAAHYDLSNEFYALFLDETMTYSCGIFENADSTLHEASIEKLDRICRKLALKPNDSVLEIGTGWGSFAMHAAQNYGCHVTTTTISQEQFDLAKNRIKQAGLTDRVTVLQTDYRQLDGQYDKLVSIEMIEAIGWRQYPQYFQKCSELLKSDGAACIQAITKADRYYESSKRAVDFIKRYIFPGSCIPSIGAMAAAVAESSNLTIAHLEDITPHYATTLRCWRNRFQEQLPNVRALGFSDAFIRMWEFYLCYCEAGFRERVIGDVQMILTKPGFRGRLPLGAL
ncbi:MAG: class I SAM-dependent methyltransferase [Phycisphaerales bacterium]|nr:class I SAM-dependent methyltransferase [Phycisphaerales bacterium]